MLLWLGFGSLIIVVGMARHGKSLHIGFLITGGFIACRRLAARKSEFESGHVAQRWTIL
jgi:hypothetical protein